MPEFSSSRTTNPPNETQSRGGSDADLRRELRSLLGRSSLDGVRLDKGLRELAKKYEGGVYDELIQLLTSVELKQDAGFPSW